ncbi:MAG: MBOAT family protein [Clostridiales bacterium]|jgi:alginate O-acetyltransferase complex protein AlgI|nr:MBOAT family protein [Clostridiales bacterium]
MVFSSLLFMFIYLPVVLAVYYLSPHKWRNLWLFVVNLVFYGWGEPVYIFLMVFSITVNYIHGMLIGKHRANDRLARRLVISNTIINLALLMFFKYFDFIASNLSAIPGLSFIQPIGLTLPIGISFYTFQTMSYPIDVYRGDADVQKNYISFGTFVALFPQLIAGPIVRYKDIASQLSFRSNSAGQFASGVRRFTVGLGKKVLLANNIGMLWDIYYSTPVSQLSTLGAWLGILAFSFQIYFDFSGYSDMAIGLGRMLGFEFLENFNYPYISRSITEFWRRWHISLGTWFRDYVYIPLGGNRRGTGRTFLNLFIVWSLTGIWHGASWNFLLWGVYYAILLMLEKAFLLKVLDRAPRVISHIYTLLLVVIGWVLFAIEDISHCASYLSVMFGLDGVGLISQEALYYLKSYGPTLIILAIASIPAMKQLSEKLPVRLWRAAVPALIAIVLVLSTGYLVDSTYNPFLYFRF